MMQVQQKWKVTVLFEGAKERQVLWLHDTFAANVLRKLADISFSEGGLQQPIEITITPVRATNPATTGVMSGLGSGAVTYTEAR
jgi:hypothetical protein